MKMQSLIFISLFICVFLFDPTTRTLSDLSCTLHENLRKDCGFYDITKEQCEAKDCCFAQPSQNGIPWCFYGVDDVPTYYTLSSSKSCALDRDLRQECGYYGIQKAECESRDCCFKMDDYESIIPWCFHGYYDTKEVVLEDRLVYVETGE